MFCRWVTPTKEFVAGVLGFLACPSLFRTAGVVKGLPAAVPGCARVVRSLCPLDKVLALLQTYPLANSGPPACKRLVVIALPAETGIRAFSLLQAHALLFGACSYGPSPDLLPALHANRQDGSSQHTAACQKSRHGLMPSASLLRLPVLCGESSSRRGMNNLRGNHPFSPPLLSFLRSFRGTRVPTTHATGCWVCQQLR